MEWEDLENTWAEHTRALEARVRLNGKLLGALQLDRARSALQRQAAALVIELVPAIVAVVALGLFTASHVREPRFLAAGLALDAFAIAILADLARQLARLGSIDYSGQVGSIQRRIAELRVMRLRHVGGVLLLSTLAWTPLLVVSLEAIAHVDAYRAFGAAYLLVNVALGLAVIPLGVWISRRFGERMGRPPFVQGLMRAVAGRDLEAAERFLAALAEFERA